MVMFTRNDDSGVFVNGRNMEAPVAVSVGRRNVRLCLLLFLACAAGLAGASWWNAVYPAKNADAMVQLLNAQAAGRLKILPWDQSEPLKRGERVVLVSPSAEALQVEWVAAAPNETVVLRRGSSLETLVLLGSDKYYLMTGNGSGRIVSAGEIRGIYRGPGEGM